VTTNSYGWDRLTMGTLPVPAGTSYIQMTRADNGTNGISVKSLELTPASEQAAADTSVAAAKANSQWLTDAKYGLFFQYGAWGGPKTGTPNFALPMYEDGGVDPATPALLQQVHQQFYPNLTVNDTSSLITYSPAANWHYSANRGGGDFDDDVHYSTTAGDSASITFTGTGIQLLGPTYPGSSSAAITLDGTSKGTYSENIGTTYTPQATVYSVTGLPDGTHTLTATNNGDGNWFQIDAFAITRRTVNDTSSQISYTPATPNDAWGYSANRGAGDIGNDVHYSTTKGDSASITFTGTGIQLIAPTYSGYGSGTITVDGQNEGSFFENGTSTYQAGQTIYSIGGLPNGTHTLTATNNGDGSYFQIDAFRVVN
jgi:hypothetical protein